MRLDTPAPRSVQSEFRVLVLAAGPHGCAGIDMETGAIVRCQYPRPWNDLPEPYEVLRGRAGESEAEPPAYAPETVELAELPELAGRLRGRKANRYLRPLVHPPGEHLLGDASASVPFWTMQGDRPSITLVEPTSGPAVERDDDGLWCCFRTRRLTYRLPLHDRQLGAADHHPAAARLEGTTLTRALGWKPHRLLVALTAPHDGRCYKVVAAVLPRP